MPTYVDSSTNWDDLVAEYADTASYDVAGDVDLCKRFIVCTRVLAQQAQQRIKNGNSEVEIDPQQVAKQHDAAKEWLSANDATASSTVNMGGARVFRIESYR